MAKYTSTVIPTVFNTITLATIDVIINAILRFFNTPSENGSGHVLYILLADK